MPDLLHLKSFEMILVKTIKHCNEMNNIGLVNEPNGLTLMFAAHR